MRCPEGSFFKESAAALKKGRPASAGRAHVTEADFEEELKLRGEAGLTLIGRPAMQPQSRGNVS
jgi:hypothetical protein